MQRRTVIASFSALTSFAACAGHEPQPVVPSEPAPSVSAVPPVSGPPESTRERFDTSLEAVGLDPGTLDKRVDPCSDFYGYACGQWIEKTEIPADKSRWTRSFSVIDERNEKDLKEILEHAAAGAKDPVPSKLGEFYAACMDEAGVEKRGIQPITPLLAKAKAIHDEKSITALLVALHRDKIWALFDISSEQDFKDATRYLAYLDQNGLGLPDRDYYLKEDDKSKELREQYVAHVARMLELAGSKKDAAEHAAADVMEVETELAKVSKTRVERRDPQGLYNKLETSALGQLSPRIDWNAYFKGVGLLGVSELNVTSKPFFEGVSKLLESVPMPKWRNYFYWQVLRSTAKLLSKKFVDEDFSLQQALTGQKEIRARWKRCVDFSDESLGELLGQPFVELRFSGDSKAAAEKLIHAIGQAFAEDLPSLAWMTDASRAAARDKREAMAFLVGYPAKWRSYDFVVKKGDLAGNVLRGRSFDQAFKLAHIGKPVDRGEWDMTPPTVNAYYNPLKNQMVFPAGILQPPFYSVKASIPVNLGAMGMVVGHELTHGFDDEGSQFDKSGNMVDWWDASVKRKFQARTGCLASEYSGFEAVPGVKLNGKLTLGENIADGGGVKLAFYAYRALTAHDKEAIADGFTEDQQFFLSTAQIWCSKEHDQWARMAAQIDPHSPPRWRVNGSLRNVPEFAAAFSCRAGTPMNPEKKCGVW
jgi:putative endopeptidase